MKVVALIFVSFAAAFAFAPAKVGTSVQTTRTKELLSQSKLTEDSVPRIFGILSIATVLSFTAPDAFAVDVVEHARTDGKVF